MKHINSAEIEFAKNKFILQQDGSLYWPKKKSLILSDLHLEKSSFFAKVGDFLPPYDSKETLLKLNSKINEFDVKRIILLGDIFHDKEGILRLNYRLKKYIEELCQKYKIIWLTGNHDGDVRPHHVEFCSHYKIENINFNHKSSNFVKNEISGHFHPKVYINIFKTKIFKPCFLVGKSKLILPAYGSYTGGLDCKNEVFKDIFNDNYKVYVSLDKNFVIVN